MLNHELQEKWDTLDDKAKEIILNLKRATSAIQQYKTACSNQANLYEISAHKFLTANLHQAQPNELDLHPNLSPSDGSELFHDAIEGSDAVPNDGEDNQLLINAAKTGNSVPPSDIRQILSQASTNKKKGSLQANVTYTVTASKTQHTQSLVDRGANGGVAGTDVCVIFRTSQKVDIQGIDNHQLNDIYIGTVGGVVQTQKGPVIAIMHQYALYGKGYTIHSPAQLEWYKVYVHDKSVKVGGLQ